MTQIAEIAMDTLKNLAPLAITLFAIIVSAGIISWMYKTKDAFKIIMKNPGNVILTLLVIAAALFFYYKTIAPLLER